MAQQGSTRHLDKDKDLELGWSAVVRANGTLYLAGISAVDDTHTESVVVGIGDPVAQINWIYDTIEKVLALYGASLKHVVQEVIFMTEDFAVYAKAFEVRKRRYASCELPATAGCRVAGLDTPGTMIEVMATAVDPTVLS